MSIKNPYGVGDSGVDFLEAHGRCTCCGLRFTYRRHRTREAAPAACEACLQHLPVHGEAEEAAWRRAAEHEPRLQQWLAAVTRKADEMQVRLDQQHGQVISALRSRDKARDEVAVLKALHNGDPGGCACGSSKAPCPTARRLL